MTSVAAAGVRPLYERIDRCRSCGSAALEVVLELGTTPLADGLLATDAPEPPEPLVPLTLLRCTSCTLVQIAETVDPEVLFGRDYPYFSSVSPALVAHFRGSAEALVARERLGPRSFVLEIASNDGYMLRNFAERGIPVLGVDPAEGPARAAEERGIPTLRAFFGYDLATWIRRERGPADLVLANNVLAHVPDLNGLVRGIAAVLAPEGVAVIEVPYLVALLEHGEFDTIYHQHLCYFAVTALAALFERNGLSLNHVDRTSIHGGSLRLFVGHRREPDASVRELLQREAALGIGEAGPFDAFVARIDAAKERVRRLLRELKAAGRTIVGYGAAAKATTFLAYFGIDRETLDSIVDLNPHKVGRFMPGTRIPIRSTDALLVERPDDVLVLAWNFADEIVRQQTTYLRNGGRIIVPIPELRIVEAEGGAS